MEPFHQDSFCLQYENGGAEVRLSFPLVILSVLNEIYSADPIIRRGGIRADA